ncbi:MAG: translation initiation factor IF-2 subunit alpha [Candidatus Thermoplasmatota archaeon]|jgi:translation initiation factor 2 subunit 1|nr:translation initiation factor IF-2 subunit alpha [Candidatus Poseidoniaceae archaeon]MEC7238710.1 translation initiation factor IF-2 subunit alpha [Candidatus Thermoplasmatota archaeon]MEC7589067.1 translation initiation factor IF-2 subunit alpha [Candidatus Thermoplasmatota archaeon]GIR33805.1 MAG: translation initiation factor IF-2 subunit alpha [Euryarchaeota archaeon]|tara:strand:+ start:1244 stop:2029 length:786 start_codon:yes stop_codon:yes gene_type:complete
MSEITSTPEEGELVVVTVKNVKQNGVYVDFDEYPGLEGFIFIGEIASGWVKNIRSFVRDGQRLICKVMRTKKDGSSLELSLKSVSEERRRDRLQEWKNEQRSLQLLKVCGEKVGWSEAERDSLGEDLVSSFGTLYTAFEEAAMNETAIIDAGFEGDWITEFIEIAIENIIPPFVEIKGSLNLSINVDNGVDVIRDALISAEQYSSEKDEVSVMCFYDGAPEYRLVLKAPDFKTAEDLWVEVTDSIIKVMEENGGQAATFRD